MAPKKESSQRGGSLPGGATGGAGAAAAPTLLKRLSDLGALGTEKDRISDEMKDLGGAKGIAAAVGGSLTSGLTDAQVASNREAYGANKLPQKKRKSFWKHLMEALGDDTLQILGFSAVCSMVFGLFVSPNSADVVQGIAIIVAIILVSGINSVQNYRKDKEFQSLAEYTTKDSVWVVRNDKEMQVRSQDLVVGDIVCLRAGDLIPTDGLLIEGNDVEVNMSSLNGEKDPSERDPQGDAVMHNSALISGGSDIRMIVTAVGVNTEFGRLALQMTEDDDKQTPLQEKLSELAEQIGKGGMACGALTFAVLTALWLYNNFGTEKNPTMTDLFWNDGTAVIRFLIVGVTIVVVAVPEGLPLAVTISLAYSIQSMLADRNLVRELAACETMGSATVVATDKTGTLTENRMSVVKVFFPGAGGAQGTARTVALRKTTLEAALGGSRGSLERLATAIALNTEARVMISDAGRVQFDGSPTEGALLQMLLDAKQDYAQIRNHAGKPLARRAFNKVNKFQTTVAKTDDGVMSFVTGAPEVVLAMCSQVHGPADGKNYPIGTDDETRTQLKAELRALAREGLRVIAVAFKRLSPSSGAGSSAAANVDWRARLGKEPSAEIEGGLSLWGLFGIQDPPREGVPEAVRKIRNAGVRVMMVTGDAQDTAEEIARQCGILHVPGHSHIHAPSSAAAAAAPAASGGGKGGSGSKKGGDSSASSSSSAAASSDPLAGLPEEGPLIMTGAQFRALDEEDRKIAASRLAVLARCSPTDKQILVQALQANREVVAVTGDGTNDAAALKAADIGLAMGIAGTEVAKDASKIVITDDNFASIVATVRWGRSIKQNIRKFLTFQLTINGVALLLTFITACRSEGSTDAFPIKPVQLLWINLIMDTLAALMLATEPPSEGLMKLKPQGRDEELITPRMWKNIGGHVIYQTILLLWLTLTPAGASLFGLDARPDMTPEQQVQRQLTEDTVVFTTFVFLQLANLFNCRAVHDEWNIFEGFTRSSMTQLVLAAIIILHFFIVQLGDQWMQTTPLTGEQWRMCILLGSTSFLVGWVLRLLPLCGFELRSISTDPVELAEEVSVATQSQSTTHVTEALPASEDEEDEENEDDGAGGAGGKAGKGGAASTPSRGGALRKRPAAASDKKGNKK